MQSAFLLGAALSIVASLCWGGLAVAVQHLFQTGAFEPLELSCLRLIASGVGFVLIGYAIRAKNMNSIFRSWRDFREIAVSGVLVYLAHLTFFLAVYYSNAGTGAIFLSFTPLITAAWLALAEKTPFRLLEVFCFVLAAGGVALIVTDGDFTTLKFSPYSIFWGIAAAFVAVAYALYPRKTMMRLGVTAVVSWSIFFGGIASMALVNPVAVARAVQWSGSVVFDFTYIVLFGTIVAFWCYLKSLSLISPVAVGLIVCLEPTSAFFFSILILGETLGAVQFAGVAMVLSNVVIITLARR
ncbi:MAG: EamA family transporter [Duodenibacillus sp.]|nr:EamA family transporter [Duodenibacillus sp.]